MCRSKVCFILRGHVWYVTRIFLWLLFILVGKIYPPMHTRAFSLTSFETQSSSCDYIRVSGRLIYSPKCLLDLNNWKRFCFVRECDGFLQCFVILGPARYFFVLLLLFIIIIIIFFFCASERAVRGRKERKETLTDKPLDFENRPLGLSCLSLRTDIRCCYQLS